MKKILVGRQWDSTDSYILERDHLSIHDLVERVAQRFVVELRSISDLPQGIVYVFAGPGNNGADGLAIARRLLQEGHRVHCYLFCKQEEELSEACAWQQTKLQEFHPDALTIVADEFQPPLLTAQTLVIDALFGTGLSRPLEGGFAVLVDQLINASPATVIAVDIPSGLYDKDNSENNLQAIIKADYTLTCESPKIALLLSDNECYTGSLRILSLSLNMDEDPAIQTDYYLYTPQDARRALKPLSHFAHKGTQGHALLIAGSEAMAGAAMLAGMGAMRSGLGKLTMHLPSSLAQLANIIIPEALVEKDKEETIVGTLPKELHSYQAIAMGPGIGTAPLTLHLLEHLLQNIQPATPLLLDADALNLLALHPELLSVLPKETILTPHPGELDRIIGNALDDHHRLTKAQELAMEQELIVILKGANTATCLPTGEVIFNSSGTPALATAGSGDVLTGIILSLLAQGYAPAEAAPLGVYIHGLTANHYGERCSPRSMIARDIVEMLPAVLKMVEQ